MSVSRATGEYTLSSTVNVPEVRRLPSEATGRSAATSPTSDDVALTSAASAPSTETPVGSPVSATENANEKLVEKLVARSADELRLEKFVESREALKAITPANVGKDIMVPMTSSLYVVGKLAEADTVLCDIGTGYYVEKSPAEADDYLKRKTEYLDNNCERLEQNIQEKRKNLEAITMVMQAKARAQAEGEAAGKKK